MFTGVLKNRNYGGLSTSWKARRGEIFVVKFEEDRVQFRRTFL